jgi:hypothetical protein
MVKLFYLTISAILESGFLWLNKITIFSLHLIDCSLFYYNKSLLFRPNYDEVLFYFFSEGK